MSVAVNVWLPAVMRVTLKFFVPESRLEAAGWRGLLSVVVIATVLATLVTKFQLASTALTVILKAVPAV